jgi:hypothetical protein
VKKKTGTGAINPLQAPVQKRQERLYGPMEVHNGDVEAHHGSVRAGEAHHGSVRAGEAHHGAVEVSHGHRVETHHGAVEAHPGSNIYFSSQIPYSQQINKFKCRTVNFPGRFSH